MHLLVICGPTASGKTALAASLAHRLQTAVVSADSRQVYRGLDIGTGKDRGEYLRFSPPVPCHLIDIVDPGAVYSLYRYQSDFYRLLDGFHEANLGIEPEKPLVVAGGTGLYLEAVLREYRIANVPENAALREELMGKDSASLCEELRQGAPEIYARTDLSSKKRIVRALEIHYSQHSGPVEYSPAPTRPFTFTLFGLTLDRKILFERIDSRLEERLRMGMVEEVRGLLKQGVPPERLRALGMEYREIEAFLAGSKSYEIMVEDLRREIHFLAKRQETYFRGMERRGLPIHWLPIGIGDVGEDRTRLLERLMEKVGPHA